MSGLRALSPSPPSSGERAGVRGPRTGGKTPHSHPLPEDGARGPEDPRHAPLCREYGRRRANLRPGSEFISRSLETATPRGAPPGGGVLGASEVRPGSSRAMARGPPPAARRRPVRGHVHPGCPVGRHGRRDARRQRGGRFLGLARRQPAVPDVGPAGAALLDEYLGKRPRGHPVRWRPGSPGGRARGAGDRRVVVRPDRLPSRRSDREPGPRRAHGRRCGQVPEPSAPSPGLGRR
jgi:hypothetical protein